MSRSIPAGLAIIVALAAGTVSAGEPLRLTDRQMDAVTAGATSGARILAEAASGGVSASATSFGTGTIGATAPLSASASAGLAPNLAEAEIEGNFTTFGSPLSSISIGFFRGRTETTGDGTAQVDATGTATGDQTVEFGQGVPLPNGQMLFFTLGAGFDLPGSSA